MAKNTRPSTPFGKFFDKIGIWQPSLEEAIAKLYSKLNNAEQTALKEASGWIAIINANLGKTPDVVFDLLQEKFPNVTKESVTDSLNKVNATLLKVGANTPHDFETALGSLQTYLGEHQGNTWITITKTVVTLLTDVFLKGASPIQAIETVLEYVYRTFIKGKVVPATA